MSCQDLEIIRGITYYWWAFPTSQSKEVGFSRPVSNPIDFAGYTPTAKIYDRDPETWTESITLLATPTITLYDNASTDASFLEARIDALEKEELGNNEIEDFDGFLLTLAAADSQHDVAAINTALAAEYEPVWGAHAVSGAIIRYVGHGKIKFLPDPVRT